jgi:hypothetical protein
LGHLTKQLVVHSPIETVFSFVASPWNAPKYISSIKRIIDGPNGAPTVGQTWRAEVHFLGQHNIIELRMRALHSPGLVRFSIAGEPEATLSLRLTGAPTGKATAVALTLEVPSVPSILLGILMNPLLTADIERLRDILQT